MPCHLTLEERDRIAQLKERGWTQKEIARALERSPATISRELRRNSTDDQYLAAQADRHAQQRRRDRPLVRKMDNPRINDFVRQGLVNYWSPEQIAGRLDDQETDTVSRRHARSTPGSVTTRTANTGSRFSDVAANGRFVAENPCNRGIRSISGRRSSKLACGWVTLKATPCWGLPVPAAWPHSLIANRVTRSW